MQVELGNPNREATKIQFVSNVSHDGVDYGPDYPVKIVTFPAYVATAYIAQGRAVAVSDPEPPASSAKETELPAAKADAKGTTK